MEENQQPLTKWHELLGTLLKYLLSPVGILVSTEFSVMSKSPEVDILLLRRLVPQWTAEQLALLPDGIRDSQASDILLEFKYTESFNENALQQALCYDLFYKQHNQLKNEDVQTFLLMAKKTQQETLTRFGYEGTSLQGVYRSHFELARKVVLLSLNELSDEPHNAFIKCFASHKKEKQNAFNTLKRMGLSSFTINLQRFIAGLKSFWFFLKGDNMKIELTPEMVMEMGKEWGDVYLSGMPAEEVLCHFEPQQRLAGLTPAERLAGLKPQELDELRRLLQQT
ncbi:hypothetical protein BGP_3793 [Beggiatoa sp. PS]|nr:hypothetical protein BGP_3793 [Beggiatoa sp. PS]